MNVKVRTERVDVVHPLWRKKVDASLLLNGLTPIPQWVANAWQFPIVFSAVEKKSDPAARVVLRFKRQTFTGQVVTNKRAGYRLYVDEPLRTVLATTFLMSHMRALDEALQKREGAKRPPSRKPKSEAAEASTSFWEFLDLEFDADNRQFILEAHYTLRPSLPRLFHRLAQSPILHRIEDELNGKEDNRIQKQGWRPRGRYTSEVAAFNVIYMLADVVNRTFYVGEAKNLVERFDRGHDRIPAWTHYRYNLLPSSLAHVRLQLERMLIRDIDSILGAWAQELPELPGTFDLVNIKKDGQEARTYAPDI